MDQQNQQSIQAKTENKPPVKKIWKFIAIAAVFAFVAVGGIWFLKTMETAPSPTPTAQQRPPSAPEPQPQPEVLDTSDWQTYEGIYPIRFSYPENLELSEGDANIGSIIRLWSPLGEDKDNEFSIFIRVASVEEVIQKLEQAGFTIEKEFFIDGLRATQLKGTGTPNASIAPRMMTKVVVQVNGKVYQITDSRSAENSEIFQKLISSIKFTENSATESIANWQTYRNDEFGFEVRYPRGWETRFWDGPFFSSLGIFDPEAEQKLQDIQGELSLSGGVSIRIVRGYKSIEEFVKEEYQHPFEINKDGVLEKQDVIFPNGMPALRVKYLTPHGAIYVKLIRNEEGTIFEFLEPLLHESTLEGAGYPMGIFDQILSTFRFVEERVE